MPFKAPEAVMTGAKATPLRPPPPPQLKRVTHRFSKAKAFGLKMFLKYKTTEEFDEEDGDIAGIKVQVWAEDLVRWLDPDDRLLVGACTTKIKRWPVEHGHSYETSIERLQGFTDDSLLNHQVCIALVRMLWRSGPLACFCTDHLVVNKKALEEEEVWDLLKVIGFKPCTCPDFSLYEVSDDDQWCLGNREGSFDTDRGWEDVEEEDDDDEVDDKAGL